MRCGCQSQTRPLPQFTHTETLAAFPHFHTQKEMFPSLSHCANGSLSFHVPSQDPLTALCTLKVLISFHYPHALCLSYYIPAKPASLTMYQQKSSHFSMQLFFVKSVSCKSISVIISCSHQNLQSYGTMMRNLCYAGRTTKATFFLLLTTSCLPKHN